MKQTTFASLTYASKKKQTRKERFLDEMEACMPWAALMEVIEPQYPKAGRRGGQPLLCTRSNRCAVSPDWN